MRLAIALVVALATPAVAGPCAISGLVATPVTLIDTTIEDGGGIIVAAMPGPYSQRKPGDDVLRPPSWRLRAGKALVSPTIDVVAPGLAVYRLPAGDGAVSLVDGTQTIVTVRRSADRGASVLPAPMPTSVEVEHTTGFRGSQNERVLVHLIAPAPRGAVVMIAYGADGKVRSWGPLQQDAREVVVYTSAGRCQTPQPEIVASQVGDRITVAWLDLSGRLSARSGEVEVVAAKR
jgi:hypothetical protein